MIVERTVPAPMACDPFESIGWALCGAGMRHDFDRTVEPDHLVFGWENRPIRLVLEPLHDGPFCRRGANLTVVVSCGVDGDSEHQCGPVASVAELHSRIGDLARTVEGRRGEDR